MITPQCLELPISRTHYHGPKDVRAIEIRKYVVGLQILNATSHPRHMEAAVNMLCTRVCTALLSWITPAHLVPLYVTNRLSVHVIINLGHLVYKPGVQLLKMFSTRAWFEPTTFRLKVENTNHKQAIYSRLLLSRLRLS